MTDTLVPLGSERVTLANAANRVLAEAVIATKASPTRNLAAMDGYAIRNAPAGAGTISLRVVGQAAPACPYPGPIAAGDAVRIFTGAVVPEGADRVVPQELASCSGSHVAVPTRAGAARHVRERGSDFAAGTLLLPAGRLLDPRALLTAGAADAATLCVRRKPRFFTLATGDEVRRAGSEAPSVHSIPDSVSPAVVALGEAWGAESVGSAIVPDRIESIEQAACAAMRHADVLILTGGASVGDRDFSKAALASLGLSLVFSKVAMKPGKPIWYGRVKGVHVLGLPGNPTAALVTARLFLVPLLCGLLGRPANAALPWRPLALATPLAAGGDRETFLCGVAEGGTVRPIDRQDASGQASIAMANALIRGPANGPPRAMGGLAMVVDF